MSNRLPYFTRVAEKKRPSLRLQKRDIEILKAVMNHRFITSSQLKNLLWWIPERSLQGRLKKLYHHEFLNRPKEQRVLRIMDDWQELVYSLGDRGVNLLANHLGLDKSKIIWHTKSAHSSYLMHALFVSEFRITLTLATQPPEERAEKRLQAWKKSYKSKQGRSPEKDTVNLKKRTIEREENERQQDFIYKFYKEGLEGRVELESWEKGKNVADSSFYKENSGRRKEFPIVPDGYFVLSFPNLDKKDHWFFEADRGTESGRRFKKKIEAYWNYKTSRSGRTARREKGLPEFRVLTITEERQRRDFLIDTMKKSSIKKKAYPTFWFGAKEDYRIDKPETIFEKIFTTLYARTVKVSDKDKSNKKTIIVKVQKSLLPKR